MFFEKLRKNLAKKLITEQDIQDSETYRRFLKEYRKTHEAVREFLRKYRDFEPLTPYEDINLIEDGPELRKEMTELEKLIIGKDNLILLEREKIKKIKKDLKEIEEHYREHIPQEILYAVFLHVHEPMIALDTEFKILDFTHEAGEYFESDIQRNMPYCRLFEDIKEFNEYASMARELTKETGYFRMKIKYKNKDRLNTITEPAYSDSGSRGYVTKLETEGKLKSLLQSVRKMVSRKDSKAKIMPNPDVIPQN